MDKKFISVEGIRLAYIKKNPDSKHIIFFIHGNSESSSAKSTADSTSSMSKDSTTILRQEIKESIN